MNNWAILGIIVGILVVGGIALASAISISQSEATTPSTTSGCGKCNGTCTNTNGCGLSSCKATTKGTCGCKG